MEPMSPMSRWNSLFNEIKILKYVFHLFKLITELIAIENLCLVVLKVKAMVRACDCNFLKIASHIECSCRASIWSKIPALPGTSSVSNDRRPIKYETTLNFKQRRKSGMNYRAVQDGTEWPQQRYRDPYIGLPSRMQGESNRKVDKDHNRKWRIGIGWQLKINTIFKILNQVTKTFIRCFQLILDK